VADASAYKRKALLTTELSEDPAERLAAYFDLTIAGMMGNSCQCSCLVAKLNGAVVKTLGDPAVRAKLAEQSYEVGPREEQTPEYLGTFLKAETEKWWPIIKAAGIKGG